MNTTTNYGLKKPEETDYIHISDLNYNADILDAEVVKKQDKAAQVTTGTSITLADNTEYRLTNVTTLTIAYPSGNFECWMRISTASSGTVTITLPTSQYIGTFPTIENGKTYEMSIKDGIVVCAEVGDGT